MASRGSRRAAGSSSWAFAETLLRQLPRLSQLSEEHVAQALAVWRAAGQLAVEGPRASSSAAPPAEFMALLSATVCELVDQLLAVPPAEVSVEALSVVEYLMLSVGVEVERSSSRSRSDAEAQNATLVEQLRAAGLAGRLIDLLGWLCGAVEARSGLDCLRFASLASPAIVVLTACCRADRATEAAALPPAARLGAACVRAASKPGGEILMAREHWTNAGLPVPFSAASAASRLISAALVRVPLPRDPESLAWVKATPLLHELASSDDVLLVALTVLGVAAGRLHRAQQRSGGGGGGNSGGAGAARRPPCAAPAAHEELLAALGASAMGRVVQFWPPLAGCSEEQAASAFAGDSLNPIPLLCELRRQYFSWARRGGSGDVTAASGGVPPHLQLPFACVLLQLASCCVETADRDAVLDSSYTTIMALCCLDTLHHLAKSHGEALGREPLPVLLEWGAPVLASWVCTGHAELYSDTHLGPALAVWHLLFSSCPGDELRPLLQAAPASALRALAAIARAAADGSEQQAAGQGHGCLMAALEFSGQGKGKGQGQGQGQGQQQQQRAAALLSVCFSAAKALAKWADARPMPQLRAAIRLGQVGVRLADEQLLPVGEAGSSRAGGRRSRPSSSSTALAAAAMAVVGRALPLAGQALQQPAAAGGGRGGPGASVPAHSGEDAEVGGSAFTAHELGRAFAEAVNPLQELLPLVHQSKRDSSADGAATPAPLQELLRQGTALLATVQQVEQQLAEADVAGGSGCQGADATTHSLLQQPAAAGLAAQLQALGDALCAQHPSDLCCNNPDCTALGGESKAQLVAGKAHLCSGCRTARYCGRACQVAHWRAHKPVCRRLAGPKGAAAGGGGGSSGGKGTVAR